MKTVRKTIVVAWVSWLEMLFPLVLDESSLEAAFKCGRWAYR